MCEREGASVREKGVCEGGRDGASVCEERGVCEGGTELVCERERGV